MRVATAPEHYDGAGVEQISETTGMTPEDVKAMILAETLRYPEVDAYYEMVTETIKRNRKPTSTFIPHPTLPGKPMCQLGRSYFRTPDGCLYGYMESPVPDFVYKQTRALTGFSPTEIKNYVVQGTGGTWMKAALWLLVRVFYGKKNFDGKALLVNSVHDAAYADAHKDVAFEAAQWVHVCMSEASNMMAWLFQWDIPVPVPSETTMGASMIDDKRIPGLRDGLPEKIAEVRRRYLGGNVPSWG